MKWNLYIPIMKGSLTAVVLTLFFACRQTEPKTTLTFNPTKDSTLMNGKDTVTFGAGCFWCVEAVFQQIRGVSNIKSGYMGGKVANPTYREVCSGLTGHAEVIRMEYDRDSVSFDELLEVFWSSHDPTTMNRQGNDIGTQYRSVIFYHNEEQREKAEAYKQKLNDEKAFDKPIVTQIVPASEFYEAEDYHQNYYNLNSDAPYCSYVIKPKLDKVKKVFKDKLKNQNAE